MDCFPTPLTVTCEEVALVQQSFRSVAPVADQTAALFYARLFEIDPRLRRLFRGDMEAQGRRLIATLSLAIESLDHFEAKVPVFRRLGARHGARGVRAEHYASIGAALLWALERGLGHAFTPVVKTAWTDALKVIANAMIDGAHTENTA